MPDVVELARAFLDASDNVLAFQVGLSKERRDRILQTLDDLRAEVARIEALRAKPPAPGTLDAALLAEVERVRGQGA